jgi:hypothetical protein
MLGKKKKKKKKKFAEMKSLFGVNCSYYFNGERVFVCVSWLE